MHHEIRAQFQWALQAGGAISIINNDSGAMRVSHTGHLRNINDSHVWVGGRFEKYKACRWGHRSFERPGLSQVDKTGGHTKT